MTQIQPQKIILRPVVTEKSVAAQDRGLYSFWVSVSARKPQISQAFESIFKIKPLKINLLNLKGKTKTDWKKRLPIHRPDRKKAIITVKRDQKIEILSLKNDQK